MKLATNYSSFRSPIASTNWLLVSLDSKQNKKNKKTTIASTNKELELEKPASFKYFFFGGGG